MPHEALDSVVRASKNRPDVVLGDRFGASASSDVVDFVEAAFASAGFKVARNTPFAGAYIAQTYGRPSRSQHAIQIEIDRSIYMNEATLTPCSRRIISARIAPSQLHQSQSARVSNLLHVLPCHVSPHQDQVNHR